MCLFFCLLVFHLLLRVAVGSDAGVTSRILFGSMCCGG
jgi:hypothetical protein